MDCVSRTGLSKAGIVLRSYGRNPRMLRRSSLRWALSQVPLTYLHGLSQFRLPPFILTAGYFWLCLSAARSFATARSTCPFRFLPPHFGGASPLRPLRTSSSWCASPLPRTHPPFRPFRRGRSCVLSLDIALHEKSAFFSRNFEFFSESGQTFVL